ncbi:MAG: hypothetical protein CSYNP_03982 [Syntrophus sp. SKADARSKE-3]|nr:hypothetical protein [Syntrophus sp. SKADARSKE-3]
MKYKTHIMSGALLGEIGAIGIGATAVGMLSDGHMFYHVAVIGGASILGSVFPDIDVRIPGLKHRTITHWPIPYVCGVLLGFLMRNNLFSFLCLGALIHIFLDSMTVSGVPLLSPFKKYKGFSFIRTDHFQEIPLRLAMACIFILIFSIGAGV